MNYEYLYLYDVQPVANVTGDEPNPFTFAGSRNCGYASGVGYTYKQLTPEEYTDEVTCSGSGTGMICTTGQVLSKQGKWGYIFEVEGEVLANNCVTFAYNANFTARIGAGYEVKTFIEEGTGNTTGGVDWTPGEVEQTLAVAKTVNANNPDVSAGCAGIIHPTFDGITRYYRLSAELAGANAPGDVADIDRDQTWFMLEIHQ